MREIKFRAWDKEKKEMLSWNVLKNNEVGFVHSLIGEGNWIGMQFTGLKDKNGKEIHEGDIVKTPAGNGFIEWRDNCFKICWDAKYGTTLHDTPSLNMEVIGNIYENKELLK